MENIEAMLCAYIEGDLDAAGRAQIEKHLQDHPQHRKLIQELTAMRELVRGLPRVKAPMELGESLRGKVERSMLLGDTGDTPQQSARGNRWPQVFAIAAVFLLCASLCLVLYKALGPTMKPAVFTEGVAAKLSVAPPAYLMTSPSVPTTRESLAANISTDTRQIEPGSPLIAPAGPAASRPSTASQQQPAVVTAQFNVEAIRQRLLNSGIDIVGANASSPVLMVVSSTDLPATNAQVTQFLNDSSGISWKKVPVNVETKSIPATLPSAKVAGQMSASADGKFNWDRESGAPTTQPASDVYVAKGLTPQRTDVLRQSLAVQQNGAEVQVFLQPAGALATTQPSVAMSLKDADSIHLGSAALPATGPSEAVNSGGDLAAPTTLPANESSVAQPLVASGGNRPSAGANGIFVANSAAAISDNSQILQPVNTVIVIQSTSAAASTPGSAPQLLPTVRLPAEENSPPATQPSPSTQP
ncbi:MAG: hypothetical protein ABSB74_05885 [Tepidisphaeraceae bacterium]